jgi:hypothetical protein
VTALKLLIEPLLESTRNAVAFASKPAKSGEVCEWKAGTGGFMPLIADSGIFQKRLGALPLKTG